jgi:hypothetical protein
VRQIGVAGLRSRPESLRLFLGGLVRFRKRSPQAALGGLVILLGDLVSGATKNQRVGMVILGVLVSKQIVESTNSLLVAPLTKPPSDMTNEFTQCLMHGVLK